VISKSLSVVSSVIDSAVDLATSVILFWAWRAIKRRDHYQYPQGILNLVFLLNNIFF
jgi:divalent metal cation (Fe/Co/Zn/Cd) transporter